MSLLFAVNSDNDLFVGPDGNLAMATGLPAVLQACEHACKAQRGEMVLNTDRGVPTMETIWSGSPNGAQYDAALRAAIMAVRGVTGIQSITAQVTNGVLSYTATIETIYGIGAISG